MMATALATPLSDNGHQVHVVGTHLDRDEIESMWAKGVHPRLSVRVPSSVRADQLEVVAEAFQGASVVLVGVNSFGMRWAGQQLARLLRPGQDVLAVAKGMAADAEGTLRILPEVLAEQVAPELRRRSPGRPSSGRRSPVRLPPAGTPAWSSPGATRRPSTASGSCSGPTPITSGPPPTWSGPSSPRP
jgi:hypothetical protein